MVSEMVLKSRPASLETDPASTIGRSLEDIKQTLREHMPELAERYKIKSQGIFGSYVRGEAGCDSDVDLLIEFSEVPDIFKFMDLEEELAGLLGLKVDLVTRPSLKGSIGIHILSEVISV